MQGEKIAADLREAQEAVGGNAFAGAGAVGRGAPAGAPRRQVAGAGRARGEGARRRDQRAGRGRPASRARRCAPPTSIRASSSASRSGCSRCAPPSRKYSTSGRRSRRAGRANTPPTSPLIDAGAEQLEEARSSGRRGRRALRRGGREALAPRGRRRRTKLDKAVNAELRAAQARARRVHRRRSRPMRAAPGPQGIDRVEFWVQTNPGTRPGPLMKVASGGELSRFLLALKVVLADRGSAPTLVFDEIDTGVGGAVADAIGARLARLAGKVQVLAVTHAPQVAARADQHLPDLQGCARQGQARRRPASTRSPPSTAARRSPACWPAPRSPTRRAARGASG